MTTAGDESAAAAVEVVDTIPVGKQLARTPPRCLVTAPSAAEEEGEEAAMEVDNNSGTPGLVKGKN